VGVGTDSTGYNGIINSSGGVANRTGSGITVDSTTTTCLGGSSQQNTPLGLANTGGVTHLTNTTNHKA
jgi:hypothetical protein